MIVSLSAWAGGLVTNTNHTASFGRMMARGATSDIDAVFSNPAGTAFNDHEGLTLSLNNQSAFQTRGIQSTFEAPFLPAEAHDRYYEGTTTAPIIPAVFALYKQGKWAFQGYVAIVGGGGKCTFKDGLPMFDDAVMTAVWTNPKLAAAVGKPVTPDMYNLHSSLNGKQFIIGGDLGASYRFNEHLSGHASIRINYATGNYSGGVDAHMGEMSLAKVALDCDQTGWGVTPILGINYKVGGITLAAKYEFKTNLNITNNTKQFESSSPAFNAALAGYQDGVKTANDIPAMLALAAGYEILPERLRATVEYHFFDDKHAGMAGDKQQLLVRGTNEYLAGVEWDINKKFTVGLGGQITDYGLSDDFQAQTAFSCDSYSLGAGGSWNINPHLRLNVSYFWTNYSDYTKPSADKASGGTGYCGTPFAGTDIYSRSNKVLGIGIDYKF